MNAQGFPCEFHELSTDQMKLTLAFAQYLKQQERELHFRNRKPEEARCHMESFFVALVVFAGLAVPVSALYLILRLLLAVIHRLGQR
jgi:hypothetical protein